MPSDNARLLANAWDAWNRGDYPAAMSLLAPDFVYIDGFVPDSVDESHRGAEGLMAAWQRWCEPWEQITTDTEAIVGTGDRLVSIHRQHARARESGVPVELLFAYVVDFSGGRIARLQSYRDVSEALGAAGLSAEAGELPHV